MIPLLIAMPFGPMLAWKRGDSAGAAQRLAAAVALGVVASAASYAAAAVAGALRARIGVS